MSFMDFSVHHDQHEVHNFHSELCVTENTSSSVYKLTMRNYMLQDKNHTILNRL